MWEEVRPGRREDAGWGDARGWPDSRLEVRARVERTLNMRYIFVTLDVSHLEMSALKFCKPLKR